MRTRIKKIRKDLDLTQQEFADRLGIKRGAIANYEIGRNEPVDSVVSLICREFNINEEWLRTGTGEMFAPEPEDEFEQFAARYRLSPQEQIFFREYLRLDDDGRKSIREFMERISEEIYLSSHPGASDSGASSKPAASSEPAASSDPDAAPRISQAGDPTADGLSADDRAEQTDGRYKMITAEDMEQADLEAERAREEFLAKKAEEKSSASQDIG